MALDLGSPAIERHGRHFAREPLAARLLLPEDIRDGLLGLREEPDGRGPLFQRMGLVRDDLLERWDVKLEHASGPALGIARCVDDVAARDKRAFCFVVRAN